MNTCLNPSFHSSSIACARPCIQTCLESFSAGAPHGGLAALPNAFTQSISLSNIKAASFAEAASPEAVETCRTNPKEPKSQGYVQPASRLKPRLKMHKTSIWRQRMSSGGADRDRTGDPLLAKQVLSQLSYSPLFRLAAPFFRTPLTYKSIEASWMQRPGDPAPGPSEKHRTLSGDTRTGSPRCRSTSAPF